MDNPTYAKGRLIELSEERRTLISEHTLALGRICNTVKAEENPKALWGDETTRAYAPVDTTLAKSTLENLEQIQQSISQKDSQMQELVEHHDLGSLLGRLR